MSEGSADILALLVPQSVGDSDNDVINGQHPVELLADD
jgi:hypothetical protein